MPRTITLVVACLLVSLLAYGAGVTFFRARIQDERVQLEWPANREQVSSGYEVYRQEYPADEFVKITTLVPTAQPWYRYTDPHVLRPNTSPQAVTYRLAVRTATGTRTYQTTPVPPADNVVVRSWDTIKRMFR
ncbi:hypothetical protein [Hymenobacter metallilatus]|uniref:Fibronectin type III domain-containing protein n=1 Tax=Hymenobacter metallilatus TaxID=2493666 RepID=A0A428JPY5_9BACT|nr:hypothetical protein [Hymenobacter metallilatus]RSK35341.1 hypothetical protein EI290_06480 [Hymenobacter metallilatus]